MTFTLLACAIAALGLALLGIAGPAYRIGVLSLPNAFTLFRWAAYAGLAATLVGLVAGGLAYRRGARVATFLAAMAALGGAAAFGIPFEWQRQARSVPPIHDITTDLERPPTFDAIVPLRADAPNSLERPSDLSERQRLGYPDLAPMTLPVPSDQAFDRALAAARQAGWTIVTADKGTGRIEASDTTRWFGFTDDVVVRLTPSGDGTRVDVRSVSRVGGSDVGTNARRIRQYLAALREMREN
ncbi:MAG: DUF1499 domain-containing protein [Acidobacteria bacterium]|nr:DUF1499 domain-containing protein [Acidobacteriota bacterium]